MAKHDRKGRSTGEPRHLRLYHWLLDSEAWRSLDVYERTLYVEFKRRYNGTNNGGISFSGEDMRKAMNCSNVPADRALRTLIHRGFVKLSQRGHFDWKTRGEGGNRASTYILTEYPIDLPVRSVMPPTKDFMRWRPDLDPQRPKKPRGELITRKGRSRHPRKELNGLPDHPNEVTSSPVIDASPRPDQVMSSPSCNIPYSGCDAQRERASNSPLASREHPGRGFSKPPTIMTEPVKDEHGDYIITRHSPYWRPWIDHIRQTKGDEVAQRNEDWGEIRCARLLPTDPSDLITIDLPASRRAKGGK